MSELLVLFRSGDESDPYEEALDALGFDVRSVPVLEFELVNAESLRAALEHHESYGGMILTSPRAVDALGDAMPWLPSENVLWHAKPVFAVGPRTADGLRAIGFEPEGEESGSADMLARFIRGRRFDHPLLFLCGNRRRDVLPDRLRDAGIQIEELCVYESRPRMQIAWPADREPDWVVLFSPSGLDAVLGACPRTLYDTRIAAIGPTTAAALRSAGFDVSAVAAEPSPDALAAAIRTADRG